MMADGGPAFPRPYSNEHYPDDPGSIKQHVRQQDGMSVRDYMATQLVSGFMVELMKADGPTDWYMIRVADVAYEMADAMLEARHKGEE